MSKPCHICISPRRAEIELSVANGTPYKTIAEQYGTSPPAITRHTAAHIKQAAKAQQAAREEAKTLDVLSALNQIHAVSKAIMTRNFIAGKDTIALQAVDRIQKQAELAAKLQGDLSDSAQIDITLHSEWAALQSKALDALRDYPQARLALVEALSPLETFHAHLN